jgi:HlyD family secretion protein
VIKTNNKEDVLRIPKNAMENIDGKDILQIITNGKVEDRQITAGLEGNDYVEVLSGLNEGDEVIVGKK